MTIVPLEWVVLANKLDNDPTIKKRWGSAEDLYSVYLEKRAYVSTIDIGGNLTITAFGALWETSDPSILETGTIWKDSANMTKGVSLDIIQGLQRLLPNGVSTFLVSRHKKILQVAEVLGWELFPEWQHSPCSRVIEPSRNMGEGRQLYFLQSAS